MKSALPATRRTALAQVLAAGTLFSPISAYARSKPSAANLEKQRALLAQLMVRGKYPVKTANPLSFEIPGTGRDMLVRVCYPDPATPSSATFPVVLFSHAERSSKDLYNPVAEHWASHGIVTILPTHVDSGSLNYVSEQKDYTRLIGSRIGDLGFLLDHLDEIDDQAPGLSGRLDKERVTVGGHGLGTLAALSLAGLPIKLGSDALENRGDQRVRALVSYNGIGPLPFLDEDWSKVTVPTLAITGTDDPGVFGDSKLPWRWRLSPYTLTAGKARYGVSISLGNHTYGGLISDQNPDGKPDATGLAIANAMSTAFVKGQVTGDHASEEFLKTTDLSAVTDNRAFLERP